MKGKYLIVLHTCFYDKYGDKIKSFNHDTKPKTEQFVLDFKKWSNLFYDKT